MEKVFAKKLGFLLYKQMQVLILDKVDRPPCPRTTPQTSEAIAFPAGGYAIAPPSSKYHS
ncbi:MAG: hypothetical protein HWQ38_35015 [Nostoc sp. NMS7]|uniref:hypothetical protein n=1 Tax=Nostoc sp. NMS7 TaxID=2815391 RepID=UPI0025DA544C|nr:hypothetical protein [Nostoc sp. NMS7]MBN3951405.1 hypothetical protein [Nostoc sp. NMS7]